MNTLDPHTPYTETPENSATETADSSTGTTDRGLNPAVQKHIGNLLKVSFQDLLTDPVPDRFANLLDQLEQAEKKGK